jgi:hypothetical protein
LAAAPFPDAPFFELAALFRGADPFPDAAFTRDAGARRVRLAFTSRI